MADNKLYNHSDIARYLQQKMSSREMHDFEKAMLEDPFLADAMEGFSQADQPTVNRHLKSIEKEILGQHEQAKVVPIVQRKTAWWQVAAVVLLLISAGIVTYRITNSSSSFSTAQQVAEVKSKDLATLNDTVQSTDGMQPAEANKPMLQSLPGNDLAANTTSASPVIAKPEASAPLAYKQQIATDTTYIVMEEKAEAKRELSKALVGRSTGVTITANSRQMDAMAHAPVHEFVGKVVDPSGEPVPFASIRAQGTNIGTVADAKGNFSFKAPDSVVQISVQNTGYAKANVRVSSSHPSANITLQQDRSDLSEVVVTEMASKRKRTSKESTEDSAEPVGGWENFHSYVKTKLDSLHVKNSDEINYLLEFSIDNKGTPTNIRVVNDENNVTSNKIKEILQTGPRWRNAGNKEKVNVTIKH